MWKVALPMFFGAGLITLGILIGAALVLETEGNGPAAFAVTLGIGLVLALFVVLIVENDK